jgi:hypothetical protein
MFILIEYSYDENITTLFSDIVKATDAFNEACEESSSSLGIYLVIATEGVPFGFGSRDDIFGAEVIQQFINEDPE